MRKLGRVAVWSEVGWFRADWSGRGRRERGEEEEEEAIILGDNDLHYCIHFRQSFLILVLCATVCVC